MYHPPGWDIKYTKSIPILLRLQVSPGGGGAPAAGGRLTNLNLKKAPAHAHEVTLAGDSSRERERERESRFHELAACKTLALITGTTGLPRLASKASLSY